MKQTFGIILMLFTMGVSQGQLRSENKLTSRKDFRISPVNPSNLNLFRPSFEERKDLARNLILDRNALAWVWENEPDQFTTTIPLPDHKSETFTFVRNYFSTESFVLETSDGRKLSGKDYAGIHYKLETPGRIGGLSFREDGVLGVITNENGAINIGEVTPGRGNYVAIDDRDVEIPAWSCETDESMGPGHGVQIQTGQKATTSCKTVKVYFEADYDLYTKSGNSLTTASNFVNGLFNIISQVYAKEQIALQISGVYVWTTTDPYATVTSANAILLSFATNRTVASVNGNLAHFLTTRSSGLGGVAYLGVLCHPTAIHGVSNIYYNYSALPNYSWSVKCVSHELGHNFGSRHTQWCGWDLPGGGKGRIDSCAAGEAYNGVVCSTVTKARKGTIMSYCHLTLEGVDMNLGFGTQPGNTIRTGLANATCISGTSCLGTASATVDSASNKDRSYRLTVSIPANHNAVSWKLMEGSTVFQSGTLSAQTALSLPFNVSGKANGTYNYSVILTSSTGTTTTSSTLAVVVAVPPSVPTTGNCVANGLVAWFAADGKLNFKFNLSPTCTTYTVSLCRYNMNNPNVVPTGSETPTACSVRNNMNNYTPTTTEKTLGYIERVANPQPGNMTGSPVGNYWYSVDVVCSGSGCTTNNRTRTYIFVQGQ